MLVVTFVNDCSRSAQKSTLVWGGAPVKQNYTSVTLTMSFSSHWLSSLVCDPSLGNFRLGSFAWELSLGIFRLGTFAWEFRSITFAWDLSRGNFRLGYSAWDLSKNCLHPSKQEVLNITTTTTQLHLRHNCTTKPHPKKLTKNLIIYQLPSINHQFIKSDIFQWYERWGHNGKTVKYNANPTTKQSRNYWTKTQLLNKNLTTQKNAPNYAHQDVFSWGYIFVGLKGFWGFCCWSWWVCVRVGVGLEEGVGRTDGTLGLELSGICWGWEGDYWDSGAWAVGYRWGLGGWGEEKRSRATREI